MDVNARFSYPFCFFGKDLNTYADATGDRNLIHLDDNIAQSFGFKSRIVHGMLAGSVFSKVFGTLWPGTGTIYLEQSMKFLRPLYLNTEYLATFEVIEIQPKNKAVIKTQIVCKGKADVLIDGIARIKFP